MFFEQLSDFGQCVATVDVGIDASGQLNYTKLTYAELSQRIHQQSTAWENAMSGSAAETQGRYIVILKLHSTSASIIDYLSLLHNRVIAILVDPNINAERLHNLVEQFKPSAIIEQHDITVLHRNRSEADARTAILLPTSGSTGSAKYVALSYVNLQANVDSICAYLPLEQSDRAMNTLPLFYSYGLSIVNTHLSRGAQLVLSPFSVVNREFWQVMQDYQITSFAGVPHTYEMLSKLRFNRRELPALRYFTQAGGKLKANILSEFAAYAEDHKLLFYIMYGQTEATARMAYLSPDKLLKKPDSIGQAIPQGEFKLESEALFYRGPNVMLGYCRQAQDLVHFDPINWLATGDLAQVDDDGDYYIIGREKRFLKIHGVRVDLDAIEHSLHQHQISSYCCGDDERLIVAVELSQQQSWDACKAWITAHLHTNMHLHPAVVTLMNLPSLPLNANKKPDYQRIAELANKPD